MFLIRRASSTPSSTLCRILTQYKRHIRPLSSSSSSSASSYGLYRLLTQDERQILDEQRKLTETSRKLTSRVGATRVGATSLDRILSSQSSSFLEELQLETTFSVIIAGEFNAGKSTLINALLGSKLLESGALPTTDSITIVASSSSSTVNKNDGDTNSPSATAASTNDVSASLGVIVHSVSTLPLLDDLTLIDTPGTNSAWMDHTEQTLRLLPAADLILFVTSADRPFSDSERNLLKSIQAYHKNIVVVINKMDILDTSGGDHGGVQKQDVLDFVTDKASELLGARPVVIPISARNALSSKLTQSSSSSSLSPSAVWDRSNFAALETFLKDTLTTKAKIKSKLSNPLGVTEGVMTQCLDVLKEQQEELKVDVATLNIFRSQFEGWKKELAADLILSQNTMTDMVREEGHRCDILLNRMNIYNYHYWTLFDTNRLEEEWVETKREVSIHRQHDEDLKADLMEHVLETAESVATRGRAQGQAVIEYLGKRPAVRNNQSLVGSVTIVSNFEDTRKNLVERLSNAVDDILNTGTDKTIEREHLDKDQLFRSLKHSALLSSSLQVGALSSGGLLALQMIDPIVGWVSLSSLLFGGGASYAMGKARIRQWYNEQWSRRAHHLNKALEAITNKEVEKVNRRILDGVAPYTRFVETEQERICDLQEQCQNIASASRNLRNRIDKLR